VALAVLDERNQLVAASDGSLPPQVTSSRTFPLFFFNPLLVATGVPDDLEQVTWRVQAGPAAGSSFMLTSSVARRMLVLQGVAATAMLLGLWLTVRAGRSGIRLTELRTDFVSSVTHEFKTPIATIAGAGELLASGRIQDAGRQREYAGFIVQESRRLSRLVDNLLAFARITDATVVDRHLEWIRPHDLIYQALQRFAVHIEDGHFAVVVDAPATGPLILGDVSALRLMLENLIDNVIRHARRERAFTIRAHVSDARQLTLEVEDRGGGIPEDEIHLVTRKFYRGRKAGQGGTGLGLAIATRVAGEHGGSLHIFSRSGIGTTVRVTMPVPHDAPPSGVSSARPTRSEVDEHPVELADPGRGGRSPAGAGPV
jgi:signal transduction histidine kinase